MFFEVLKELFSFTFLEVHAKWIKDVSYGKIFYMLHLFIAASYR